MAVQQEKHPRAVIWQTVSTWVTSNFKTNISMKLPFPQSHVGLLGSKEHRVPTITFLSMRMFSPSSWLFSQTESEITECQLSSANEVCSAETDQQVHKLVLWAHPKFSRETCKMLHLVISYPKASWRKAN